MHIYWILTLAALGMNVLSLFFAARLLYINWRFPLAGKEGE